MECASLPYQVLSLALYKLSLQDESGAMAFIAPNLHIA